MGGKPPDLTVIVHDRAHVLAARAAARDAATAMAGGACRLTLRSAPGATETVGLGYLAAMFRPDDEDSRAKDAGRGVAISCAIDCGRDPALAHQALAMGFDTVAFAGPAEVRTRLKSIAGRTGGDLVSGRTTGKVLNLNDVTDPGAVVLRLLVDKSGTDARPRRRGG